MKHYDKTQENYTFIVTTKKVVTKKIVIREILLDSA